jgi:hypothetical protein
MLLRYSTTGHSPVAFTHTLIDEAGQSPYPEALIPLLLLPEDGGSCLAGALSLFQVVCTSASGLEVLTSFLELAPGYRNPAMVSHLSCGALFYEIGSLQRHASFKPHDA